MSASFARKPFMLISLLVLLALLLLHAAQHLMAQTPHPSIVTDAQVVYINDFESEVGPEWSSAVTDRTPVGTRRFLGQFSNQVITLSLTSLPVHTEATLSFDLFIINSWDGNCTTVGPDREGNWGSFGPDIWDLSIVGGSTLSHTTFSNLDEGNYWQAYPDAYPGGNHPSYTSAVEVDTLGYDWYGSSVYHFDVTFPHTEGSLALIFSASGLQQAISDESWGLDNVRVTLVETSYSISGRMTDASGHGMSGVTVSAGAAGSTATDGNGAYTISGLAAGTYTLTPSKSGYSFSPASRAVSVPPDATGVDFVGAPSLAGPLTLIPIVPQADQESSIMQGGWVHRHFEVRDATGVSAPSVTVTFAPTGEGTSDAQGRLDVAIYADSLGGPGGYGLSATDASRWGTNYTLSAPVSFVVWVIRREVESFWASGAETRTRAGLSAGVKGYITRAYEGGLEARLLEKYPLSSDDDTLKLKADETNKIGGGIGLRPEVGFTLGPVKGELGAGAEAELTWKALQEFTSEFDLPYAPEQQRAEAITALVGIYRNLLGFSQTDPASQLLGQIILRLMQQNPEYRTYLKEDTAGVGVALDSSVDVGGEFDLLKFGKYSQGLNRSRFLYLEAKDGFGSKLNTLAKWTTDSATHATRKLSWQEETEGSAWANLEAGMSYGARAKFLREIGAAYSIQRTVEYTGTGTLSKMIFTVSSETRDKAEAGVDIDPRGPIDWGVLVAAPVQYQIQQRYIFEGTALQSALARVPGLAKLNAVEQLISAVNPLQIGEMAAKRDLEMLLGCSPTCPDGFTYEKWLVLTTDVQPGLELGFSAALKLNVSGDYKVQWGKEVLLERGVFLGGNFLSEELYGLDPYVDAPERTLGSLIDQAVQAAFAPIQAFFNTVSTSVTQEVSWAIEAVAQTGDGIIQGGLRLFGGEGSLAAEQISPSTVTKSSKTGALLRPAGGENALAAGSPVTVTVTASVPTTDSETLHRAQRLGIQAADPGFFVGGIYDLRPYTQTLSPAAALVITYTEASVSGRDESSFRLYHWEPVDFAWRPITATLDAAQNLATATISTLGSYAIGYDVTPPEVTDITPVPDAVQVIYRPAFRITLRDDGSGVDPASVNLEVAGSAVTPGFDAPTSTIWYTPTVPFANGPYTLRLRVADTSGNAIDVTSPFTVAVPPPVVVAALPNVIYQGITTTIAIVGSSFLPGIHLAVGPHNDANPEYLSAGHLEAVLPDDLPLGTHGIMVTNTDDQTTTLSDILQVVPVQPTVLAIHRSGEYLELTWNHLGASVGKYEVYRSSNPFSTPGGEDSLKVAEVLPPAQGTAVNWTDPDTGDPSVTAYFYVIRPVSNAEAPFPPSTRVGFFRFTLSPGAPLPVLELYSNQLLLRCAPD